MRKIVSYLAVLFLLLGCAAQLSIVKGLDLDSDTKEVLGILMEKLGQCEPDGEWQALSIPDKKDKTVQYVIYKHVEKDTWGVAIVSEEGSITCGYDVTINAYFIEVWMGQMPLSKEEFEQGIKDFIEIVVNDGNIDKAARFRPPTAGVEI